MMTFKIYGDVYMIQFFPSVGKFLETGLSLHLLGDTTVTDIPQFLKTYQHCESERISGLID